MKTLILGIGNKIKRDDVIGILAAEKVFKKLDLAEKIDLKVASAGGLPLLNKIEGYDKVFILDSIQTEDGDPGNIYFLDLDDLDTGTDRIASHTVDLKTVKKIGENTGEEIPKIHIFAIEVKEPYEFGKEMTKEMKEALPQITNKIKETIEEEVTKKEK
ncbi:hypothetical protein AKJ51_01760 [candidate division MSBL1 archaeon SCGC-AAA382A20]|uniref:Hydrogenase maturation protease n=1 Tax=candidate division MSBL1 archaeon SCGC-AAA382A20 TaxID=1698280 RepID=A0A133VLB3_9EURY|nr:hypothetical protein AKJ51_01760 [candidate division MSBL1 archaeon SCGC-AAA382A20]